MATRYAWPEWMPAPQQDSYSIQPDDLRETTETEVGAIIRPLFESDVLTINCSIVLNHMQSAWFEAFEKLANHECFWFVFPIWYAGNLHDGVCSFQSRPKWSVEGLTTTYQFTLLVQKRSLEINACLLEAIECWTPCEIVRMNENIAEFKPILGRITDIPIEEGL